MSPSPTSSVVGRAVSAVLLVAAVLLGAAPASAGSLTPTPEPSDAASSGDADPTSPDTAADPGASEAALPLTMRLRSIAPSTLPGPGSGSRVTLQGTVRNTGQTIIEDVKVYPVLGDAPMTTQAELRMASALPENAIIGDRNLTPGLFDDLGDVAPGETFSFTVSIGADDVGVTDSGVYWLGAQALGGVDGDRDTVADGRARTFVAMLGEDDAARPSGPRIAPRQVDVTFLLPVRQPVRRDGEGRLSSPSTWDALLASDGRLGRIVGIGSQPGFTPTWLIDPAVVDAAVSMAQGGPGFPLTAAAAAALVDQPGTDAAAAAAAAEQPAAGGDAQGGSDAEVDGSADAGSEGDAAGGGGTSTSGALDPLSANDAYARPGSAAATWLSRLGGALPDGPVGVDLLPYAEPDVSALARDDRAQLVQEAFNSTVEATTRLGLDGELVLAPARGFLRPVVAAENGFVDPSVPLILSERAVRAPVDPGDPEGPIDDAQAPADDRPEPGQPLRTDAGHEVVLFSQGVQRGGPDPQADLSALGVRQRVLAEAMTALLGSTATGLRPRVVAMPPNRWDPGLGWEAADVLGGLDVPWISSENLGGAAISPPDPAGEDGASPSPDPSPDPSPEPSPSESLSPDDDPSSSGQPDGSAGAGEGPDAGDIIDSALVDPEAEVVDLRYPRRQARRELSAGLVSTAADQEGLAEALGAVLVDNPDARGYLVRAALTGVSWYVRERELSAAQRIAGQAVTTLEVLRRIRLEVPSLVTMSSSSGSITVKVVNGLDQRVRIGIDATVTSGSRPGALVLDVPEALDIPADQQVTLRLRARAGRVGVNVVQLRAASPDGMPVGLPAEVNVRASTLGIQIYRFMAAAGFVLLAIVVFRVRRRIRTRRATHGPLLSQEYR